MNRSFIHEQRTLTVHVDKTVGDWQIYIYDKDMQRVDPGGLSVSLQQTLNLEDVQAAVDDVVAQVRSGALALLPSQSD